MGLDIDVSMQDAGGLISRLANSRIAINTEFEYLIGTILDRAVEEFQAYPPETKGNFPPPPYYQRGVGMYNQYGNLRQDRLSENLGQQWIREITYEDDGVTGRLINNASYSGYVHDEYLQAVWHGQHGWEQAQPEVRRLRDEITAKQERGILTRIKDYILGRFG